MKWHGTKRLISREFDLFGCLVLAVTGVLFLWKFPWATAAIFAVGVAGFGILYWWGRRKEWALKRLRKRHAETLLLADGIIERHAPRLAEHMRQVLRSNGRDDYLWEPWVPIREEFIDAQIVPQAGAAERRFIAREGGALRVLIAQEIDQRILQRCLDAPPPRYYGDPL